VTTARDDFLRRYATSPIHVPRLERLLYAYGDTEEDESFSRRFMEWDRACRDAEAARIVTEIVALNVDAAGRIVCLSDEALKGAVRWMANATSHAVADRARKLAEGLALRDAEARVRFIDFLETSGTLDDAEFHAAAQSF
jgi:hypothetical protein